MSATETPPASTRPIVMRGFVDALAYPAWIVGFSLMGVASLARDVGQPLGVVVLSSVLIWAGPGQVTFFGGIASGVALPALALAVSLTSIRLMPMTISLLPLLRRPGQGLLFQLFIAHFVAATAWTECMRRLPLKPPAERLPYFLGFANGCLIFATAMTVAGYYLAAVVPAPLAAGLLFITPIFFAVSLIAGARAPIDRLALGLGFALTPLMSHLVGTDVDLLVTGVVAGGLAFGLGRLRRTRQP